MESLDDVLKEGYVKVKGGTFAACDIYTKKGYGLLYDPKTEKIDFQYEKKDS